MKKANMRFYGCCTSILNFYSRNISDLGNKRRKQFPCYISNLKLFLATMGLNNAKMFLWCHGILQLLQVLWWNLSNVKAYSLRSCTFLLPALCSCGIFPSVFFCYRSEWLILKFAFEVDSFPMAMKSSWYTKKICVLVSRKDHSSKSSAQSKSWDFTIHFSVLF